MEKVLAIDPSSNKTGYVVASVDKEKEKIDILDFNFINLKNIKHHLEHLYKNLEDLILKYKIDKIILEKPFYGINAQTLIKLGEIRGIILLLAQVYKINLVEFTPAEVKICITGYGRSGKEEVLSMVNRIFQKDIKDYDVADAFAVLQCYYLNNI